MVTVPHLSLQDMVPQSQLQDMVPLLHQLQDMAPQPLPQTNMILQLLLQMVMMLLLLLLLQSQTVMMLLLLLVAMILLQLLPHQVAMTPLQRLQFQPQVIMEQHLQLQYLHQVTMAPLQPHQHLLKVIMVLLQPLQHLLQATMVPPLLLLLGNQILSQTLLSKLEDLSPFLPLKLHELNLHKAVMDLQLLRQPTVDLKVVITLLVLQHQTLILHRVQVIVFQFKSRAAMALVVLLHPQHTRDLTTHHLLARHNHLILIMALLSLTKIIMGLLLAALTFKLLLPPLTLITHHQTHFLFHHLTHMDHHQVMSPPLQILITLLLLPNLLLFLPTMVHPKPLLATGLQLEE